MAFFMLRSLVWGRIVIFLTSCAPASGFTFVFPAAVAYESNLCIPAVYCCCAAKLKAAKVTESKAKAAKAAGSTREAATGAGASKPTAAKRKEVVPGRLPPGFSETDSEECEPEEAGAASDDETAHIPDDVPDSTPGQTMLAFFKKRECSCLMLLFRATVRSAMRCMLAVVFTAQADTNLSAADRNALGEGMVTSLVEFIKGGKSEMESSAGWFTQQCGSVSTVLFKTTGLAQAISVGRARSLVLLSLMTCMPLFVVMEREFLSKVGKDVRGDVKRIGAWAKVSVCCKVALLCAVSPV